ncbi:hypothetical protein ATPR_1100 [Acetobacter tropicalis NBRC 101654]|uniref:Uncharacterized protein n=1 Tax=Acetobacter tropicalis NBRC 101654 TaxID=749388 RepID=F7VCK1_9PROT|nr:hypothetical protein ATPR_1100 [Acetobacter tropicalis NBRC 101654]
MSARHFARRKTRKGQQVPTTTQDGILLAASKKMETIAWTVLLTRNRRFLP